MVQSALTPENENQEQVTFKWEKVHFLYGLFIFISFWPQHMSYHCEVTFKVSHSCRTRMFSYMILDHSMVQIALKDSRIWIKSQENNRVVHIHHLSLMFLQHLSLRFLGCFFFFFYHIKPRKSNYRMLICIHLPLFIPPHSQALSPEWPLTFVLRSRVLGFTSLWNSPPEGGQGKEKQVSPAVPREAGVRESRH